MLFLEQRLLLLDFEFLNLKIYLVEIAVGEVLDVPEFDRDWVWVPVRVDLGDALLAKTRVLLFFADGAYLFEELFQLDLADRGELGVLPAEQVLDDLVEFHLFEVVSVDLHVELFVFLHVSFQGLDFHLLEVHQLIILAEFRELLLDHDFFRLVLLSFLQNLFLEFFLVLPELVILGK